MEIIFDNPQYLWFLLFILPLVFAHFLTRGYSRRKALKFANFEAIEKLGRGGNKFSFIVPKHGLLLVLRVLIVIFLVFSVAGTLIWYVGNATNFEYMLAIDSSSSMLADDFSPNRLGAAKDAAMLFVDSVPGNTNIGVLTFSGTNVVNAKLTNDKDALKSAISDIEISEVGGTNVGDAILASVNLLTNEDKSKAIILLSDGQSNIGSDPIVSADYAKKNGIVVNTIGMATDEGGSFVGVLSKLDEPMLRNISSITSGRFYIASDGASLKNAFTEIADVKRQRTSLRISGYLLLAAIALLFTEWFLVIYKYKVIP